MQSGSDISQIRDLPAGVPSWGTGTEQALSCGPPESARWIRGEALDDRHDIIALKSEPPGLRQQLDAVDSRGKLKNHSQRLSRATA